MIKTAFALRDYPSMGRKFKHWRASSAAVPKNVEELASLLLASRRFEPLNQLEYGDHGLSLVVDKVAEAIRANKRIALYADYDVDGTMSCVSWIWFLEALGHKNFVHYIPCRFKEGYGLNLKAIAHLIDAEKADLIITMDTGITANQEAAYCKERGVQFVCTDHHMIQADKMPDCLILNPKMHPDPIYKELCGCGITFVLLRRLAEQFPKDALTPSVWTDLLALTGMATICDVVPLNGVNHRLARLGVMALGKSTRPVLKRLMEASSATKGVDEKDVGFRLGPRINAVGRLEHADQVISAFIGANDPTTLIQFMDECNERRKQIQRQIVAEARVQAAASLSFQDDPVLVLGGDWHAGVVGIAASKIAEEFWRPVWLFQRQNGVCKGSARSIAGFDVTAAMSSVAHLFTKFGGHRAAGGFSFPEAHEEDIRRGLVAFAQGEQQKTPTLWESSIQYDCLLDESLATLALVDRLDELKPFGHGFEEPKFRVDLPILRTQFFYDKQTGEARHTAVHVRGKHGPLQKILFFNEVHKELEHAKAASFIVTASRNHFNGSVSLSLMGHDFELEG